jgi:uncharacterized glyoxalase superfamily protein PhnB
MRPEAPMQAISCRPLLNVADCRASLAFYHDQLGFQVLLRDAPDDRVRFASLAWGGAGLMLNQNGRARSEARLSGATFEGTVLYFQVPDARALQHAWKAKGLAVSEPEAQAYGVDEFYLRDPDGYELAFTSPIG